MDDTLKATISDAEREHAAGLMDGENVDLKACLSALFADLSDPLLAADDVIALLGADSRRPEVLETLDQLVAEKVLDVSAKTQRPFDAEGTRLFRLSTPEATPLKVLALESVDHAGRRRFQFTVNGRLIRSLARIDRLNALDDQGNQRQEIRKHVEKIAAGISSGTQVPSPVLLVMLEEATQIIEGDEEDSDSTPLSFVKIRPYMDDETWIEVQHDDEEIQRVRLVVIEAPFRRAAFDDEKPMLLVDGQQRTAALSLVPVDALPAIEMAATAVIATAEDAKRVFQVANDTVKISTDFSRALLASMGEPPGYLRPEKTRADACKRLALTDPSSPFFELVKHPGAKIMKPPVVYNSLFAIVSIFADGIPEDIVGTPEELANVVAKSYNAIKEVWPEAWGRKPTESRLMHGAGLRSMAGLTVTKLASFLENGRSLDEEETWALLRQSYERLRQRVVWTDTEAAGGTTQMKKIYREQVANRQNTAQDIQALSDFLRKESLDLDIKANKSKS